MKGLLHDGREAVARWRIVVGLIAGSIPSESDDTHLLRNPVLIGPCICRIYIDRERLNGSVRACLIDGQPDLAAQLKALKANLAAEQRAVSEQHYLVFRMLLSCTQGAWLLCHSFPYHCDCIAFLNGLEGF